jgi:hypothetical protein
VRESVGGFVHRPIAAQNQHQVRAVRDGIASQFGGVPGRIGGKNFGYDSHAGQRGSGTLENAFPAPPELACVGVVYKDRLAIRFDPFIIT